MVKLEQLHVGPIFVGFGLLAFKVSMARLKCKGRHKYGCLTREYDLYQFSLRKVGRYLEVPCFLLYVARRPLGQLIDEGDRRLKNIPLMAFQTVVERELLLDVLAGSTTAMQLRSDRVRWGEKILCRRPVAERNRFNPATLCRPRGYVFPAIGHRSGDGRCRLWC